MRHLIAGKVDQLFLEEIAKLSGLERLELEGPVTAKDLAPLLQLQNLSFISIEDPRHLADFSALLKLPALRTLLLTNAKLMPDIAWLSEAHGLEVIGIEGGTWSDCVIPTLRPLAGLRSLRAFLGVSTRIEDKSLAPLANCPNLEFLGIARVAPKSEFEKLEKAKPEMTSAWFKPEMWATL